MVSSAVGGDEVEDWGIGFDGQWNETGLG